MLRRSSFTLALLLVINASLMLSACSTVRTAPVRGGEQTATDSVMPVPGSRAGKGDGAVLFIADFKGLPVQSGEVACRWRVVNQASKKSYFLNIKPGSPYVFAQLDPGTYQTGRLGCGISRVWELDNVFKDGFVVESARVSYIGKLNFEFIGEKLDTVRKAPQAESAQSYLAALDATPAGGMQSISGFTGKPIDRSMVDGTEGRDGFDVFGKNIENPSQNLEPLVNKLKNCAKDETAIDPLRFGQLEYVSIYKQSRFTEMKTRKETNGFSDRLRSCVERSMMAYQPPAKTEVEVRVRY